MIGGKYDLDAFVGGNYFNCVTKRNTMEVYNMIGNLQYFFSIKLAIAKVTQPLMFQLCASTFRSTLPFANVHHYNKVAYHALARN